MNSHAWQAVFLGLIQGLTEFLPVSSSGHLAIAQSLLPGFRQPGILLDVLLHFGTLIAVLLYFYRDLKALAKNLVSTESDYDPGASGWRLIFGIVAASIPTAIIGLLLEERVEQWFESLPATGAGFLGTAVLLALGDWASRRNREGYPAMDPGPGQSLLIGVFQGLAVIPALSRSGATIGVGLLCGVDGVKAARFSFLLSIPAVAGATALTVLKHLDDIRVAESGELWGYALGTVVAGVVGYLCIGLMMRVMKRSRLIYFAGYCALVGVAVLAAGLR